MPTFISESRARRLQVVLRTALSPLDRDNWYRDVLLGTMDLVGAGVGTLIDPALPGVLHSTAGEAVVRPYVEYYRLREMATAEIMRHQMEVGHPALVGRPDERMQNEFMTDYLLPNRLLDMFCINTFTAGVPGPRMVLSLQHRCDDADVERDVLLLGMLAPAFRAGLDAMRVAGDAAGALGRTLDRMPGALAVCWTDGAVEHCNDVLRRLLEAEPEPARVLEGIRSTGAQVGSVMQRGAGEGAMTPGERAVVTGFAQYRVRATAVEEGVLGPRMMVLVSVARNAARPMSDTQLRERFGLTPRETEVARLLARGLRNGDVARELGVSEHTARHHTERVFQKMSVRTRSQVGAIVLSDG